MAKATTTIRQVLNPQRGHGYQADYAAWFAANQTLFNRVASFYFEVIQAHEKILDLSNKEALTALEKLTHTTESNPHPVMPLSEMAEDIPAMFRCAAINAALGSSHSFSANMGKWRKQKEKATAKGKKWTSRPPVPPRTWNKSATLYAGLWKERAGSSIMIKVWTGSVWNWIKVRITGRAIARWCPAGKPTTHQKRQSVVVTHSHRKAVQEPCKDREASHNQRTDQDLLSRSEHQ
jgi:hypothetical protein